MSHSPTAGPARRVLALAMLAATFGVGAPASGALVPLSFEQLTHKSKYVLTGEVVRARSYRETIENVGSVIFTDVTIRVRKRIAGTFRHKEITLKVPGGTVGTIRQVWAEASRFVEGELVLVFVSQFKDELRVTGWKQGKYRLSPDGETVLGRGDLPIGRPMPLSTVSAQVTLFAATKPSPPSSTQPPASAETGQ